MKCLPALQRSIKSAHRMGAKGTETVLQVYLFWLIVTAEKYYMPILKTPCGSIIILSYFKK